MNIQQVSQDTKYNIRTQISLSSSLYALLKEKAKQEEKSMAAIIREQVLASLHEEEERKNGDQEELRQVVRKIRKFAKEGKSGWAKVKNPQRIIRKWRQAEEDHWMKRVGLKA